jgi:LuxR family maltose regulon positive regulatory protein
VALGANLLLCGDERAEDLLREALFELEVANSTTTQACASAVLAAVLELGGSVDEAGELSERAARLVDTPLGANSSAAAVALASASFVEARSGRHDTATDYVRTARRKLAGFDRCAPWFNILTLVPLIRTSLLLDDAAAANELLQRLDRKMQNQDGSTPLAICIDELGDAVRAAGELFSERSWSLTAAELRVAKFLPTNLSLADIAARLYVSRNTVKSHAAAIYRKLDTNSRAEAVDRLRRAGLLTET